jgi:hypothetical protein
MDVPNIHVAYVMAHENDIIYAPKDDKETMKRLCLDAIANGWKLYGFPTVEGPWAKQIVIREKRDGQPRSDNASENKKP